MNNFRREDNAVNPVEQILNEIDSIELSYDGFDREWYEDHWDPNSWYGHYQTGGVEHWDSFEYEIGVEEMFEVLEDIIIKNISTVKNNELLDTYRTLSAAVDKASETDEAAAQEALEVFLATNLEKLVTIFEDAVLEHFEEDAQNWAAENLEPEGANPPDNYGDSLYDN